MALAMVSAHATAAASAPALLLAAPVIIIISASFSEMPTLSRNSRLAVGASLDFLHHVGHSRAGLRDGQTFMWRRYDPEGNCVIEGL